MAVPGRRRALRTLREEPDPITALRTAREALASLEPDQDDQRQVLIERHGNDFSPAELDSEVGYKKLVTVLGGGGGAGFVYIGGMQRRTWPPGRQAQDTREVGGVADERGHGGASGADESFTRWRNRLT